MKKQGEAFFLSRDDVHVWMAGLKPAPMLLQECRKILTDEEMQRAARLHLGKDRDNFILSRGILRLLLGKYTGYSPESLRIIRVPEGKPELKLDENEADIFFNLSHSGNKALYAFSRGFPVGVDIERIREDQDFLSIVQRFFSPPEAKALQSLEKSLQLKAFYTGWTRKEALLKAMSEGLWSGLDKFTVTLAPGEPARITGMKGQEGKARTWSLHDIEAGKGYMAALAVKSRKAVISRFEWEKHFEISPRFW